MAVDLPALTQATLAGSGVFDTLMRANQTHLDSQFNQGRIKGAEYATVYLGSLQSVLEASIQFLLQSDKIAAEIALINAQKDVAAQQLTNLQAEHANIEARTALVKQQQTNAVLEGAVLVAQECKLRAEFDLLVAQKLKTNQEQALLAQKQVTEQAQTSPTGVDPDSVIGRQKALYVAQTNGFTRDAEQKAAKIMIDTWNVRRTTDEATSANTTNVLDDTAIGRVVNKMLTGVQA